MNFVPRINHCSIRTYREIDYVFRAEKLAAEMVGYKKGSIASGVVLLRFRFKMLPIVHQDGDLVGLLQYIGEAEELW